MSFLGVVGVCVHHTGIIVGRDDILVRFDFLWSSTGSTSLVALPCSEPPIAGDFVLGIGRSLRTAWI